jgi:hypothetical protein
MLGQAAAASGRYTATWVLLSHSGTFDDQTLSGDDAPRLPLLRSAAADEKPPGNWKCYHPPGDALTSVLSGTISKGSTVTNFGMTLTVAHRAACTMKTDMGNMFPTIVSDLQKLDSLADKLVEGGLKYKPGGQIVKNPIENKTIFMHPMPTDDHSKTGRSSRPSAGLSEYFPGLGLYLLEVWDTATGTPVDERELDPLLVPYILGRRCSPDIIHAITPGSIGSDHRTGILPALFETLGKAGLPQYYLDGRFRSATPSAKNHVSDFEIFRGGETSKDIQQIMAKNCSVMDEEEYDSVMYHYTAGVATKRIALFDLKKVCKLLSPLGTLNFELFDIGCKDPYPNPPVFFSIMTKTWPPYKYSDDTMGSAMTTGTVETYLGDLNSTQNSPTALDSRIASQRKPFGPFPFPSAHDMTLRSNPNPGPFMQLPQTQRTGGKPHKTRQRQGKRNKSRNFRNKSRSRSRRTRRRVIKRKNN